MARGTVEDCVDKIANRFELVLVAAHRARALASGGAITIERENDKDAVVALREVAEKTISPGDMRERLIKEPLNNTRLGFCCLWSGFLPQWRTSSSGCLASRGRFGPCLCPADASVLRARNRLASASSANTCAPFLAMPR